MGMFDFVKNAGNALIEKATGAPENEELTKSVEISEARLNQLRRDQIQTEIAKLDIDGEQVTVTVNGSSAVLLGSAPSQEALEKMVLCAGNQHGVEQVDCQLQVDALAAAPTSDSQASEPAVAGESTFYTVKSGDTLGKIAQEHYGSAGKYMAIFEANQPMLSDPNKIYPGQSLRIPAL